MHRHEIKLAQGEYSDVLVPIERESLSLVNLFFLEYITDPVSSFLYHFDRPCS